MAALLGLVTGCGGDDESTPATGDASTTLAVEMGDFYFDPKDGATANGSVAITAENVSDQKHELEIFMTDADPGSLTVVGDTVDTEALEEQGAEEIGELEAEGGESDTATIELKPGSYIMICNLPTHYQEGMWGTITVE